MFSSKAKRWIVVMAVIGATGLGFVVWYGVASIPAPGTWYRVLGDRTQNSIWNNDTAIFTYGTSSEGSSLLAKLDAEGNLLWEREGSANSRGYSVWGDGQWIYTFGEKGNYPFIEKFDAATGVQQWNWTSPSLGASGKSDRSIFGANGSIYAIMRSLNLKLFKINVTTGAEQWSREWQGDEPTFVSSVWAGGMFVCTAGYMYNSSTHTHERVLVKWDADGNQLWNRTWGRNNDDDYQSDDRIVSVWGDEAGNIYTSSTITIASLMDSQDDMLLIKWGAGGDPLWNRTWGTSEQEYSGSLWGNGTAIFQYGFIFPSNLYLGTFITTSILVQWGSEGNQVWNRTWGSLKYSTYAAGLSIWGRGMLLYTCTPHYVICWNANTGATQYIIYVDWWLVMIVFGSIIAVTIVVIVGGPAIIKRTKRPRESTENKKKP
nr:hypothetical protein [Candidatus Sigynarchaeota archaeon]